MAASVPEPMMRLPFCSTDPTDGRARRTARSSGTDGRKVITCVSVADPASSVGLPDAITRSTISIAAVDMPTSLPRGLPRSHRPAGSSPGDNG